DVVGDDDDSGTDPDQPLGCVLDCRIASAPGASSAGPLALALIALLRFRRRRSQKLRGVRC
ncbi:MAG TPA: hypothetical protein DIU15_19460, partial [Deltaproteobacteria bacterium]|nr:hypothetical protein [Deltaproteobacteria bacterium]